MRLLLIIVLVSMTSCSSVNRRPVYGPAMSPQQAMALYDTTDYKPSYRWIKSNVFGVCSYCHPNTKADMFSYTGISVLVVPGMPEQSVLYQRVASGEMPKRTKLRKEKIQVIYDWIKNGAENN